MKAPVVILLFSVGITYAIPWMRSDGSCEGRCDSNLDRTKPCQCNSACVRFGDCCADYDSLCLGVEPTRDGSQSLSTIGDVLWEADVDRASTDDVRYALQGRTSTSSTGDEASNTLFVYVNEDMIASREIYSTFTALLDNYERNTGRTEQLSGQEWDEIDTFLDVLVTRPPMVKASEYLCTKGFVVCDNKAAMKTKLRELWFELYPRSGSSGAAIDSSGFEHVFVGETKSTSVTGFHSWLQFYLEERDGALDYKGYISEREPVALNARLTWHGLKKSQASFFVRSSPAFDVALYTICFLEKTGQRCNVSVQGHQLTIQTYDVGHKSGLQVATAYVAI